MCLPVTVESESLGLGFDKALTNPDASRSPLEIPANHVTYIAELTVLVIGLYLILGYLWWDARLHIYLCILYTHMH